jgi:hypothetical protein
MVKAPFQAFGGPNITFAKPVETFFELSIMSAFSFERERDNALL